MEQSSGPDQLQHILNTLKADHTDFMTIWRSHWRANDRPAVTERLEHAVANARRAAESLDDTRTLSCAHWSTGSLSKPP